MSTQTTCSRCGATSPVASGERRCVARGAGREAVEEWSIAVCRDCARRDLVEDRRQTVRGVPLKATLMTVFAVLLGAVTAIMLTEPGLTKLWAVPFGALFLRTLTGPFTLITLPMALGRLKRVLDHIDSGALDESDRDLLVHLESHRILSSLRAPAVEPHAGVRLPVIEAADPKSVSYELKRAG